MGVVALILVGRPRALPSAIVVAVPTVLVAVAAGYSADLFASDRPTSDAAASQGHVVAIVVLLCVIAALAARRALLKLDLRLMRVKLPDQLRRPQVVWGARAGALVAVLFALFVWPVNLPHQYDSFVNGDRVNTADLRSRLGTSGDNGRIEHWRAALVGFKDHPLSGTGAGTYALQWDLVGRSDKLQLQDAHSLYIEVLGELGLIGLLLVLTAIGCVLAGFFARAREKDSVVGAALFGAGITWALAAGTDWHWEMPAVTFWFFAAGGLALSSVPTAGAAARGSSPRASPSRSAGRSESAACCWRSPPPACTCPTGACATACAPSTAETARGRSTGRWPRGLRSAGARSRICCSPTATFASTGPVWRSPR